MKKEKEVGITDKEKQKETVVDFISNILMNKLCVCVYVSVQVPAERSGYVILKPQHISFIAFAY